MSDALLMFVVLLCSVLAGLVGSLTGLGGGVILTPILVLAFGIDMKYAVGASLVAVVATSSGAAAAFVREGFTNVRLAMVLEVMTVAGAIFGALLAARTPSSVIAVLFGVIMLWTSLATFRTARRADTIVPPHASDPLAQRLRLPSSFPQAPSAPLTPYGVQHVKPALAIMFVAGVLSALIGIGSGIVKVLAMDKLMKLPFKVSTTTSNFMIGVTAAASAGVYLHRGQIEPRLAAPVALGALAGALLGARLLRRLPVMTLRLIFAVLVALAGVQMVWKGASL